MKLDEKAITTQVSAMPKAAFSVTEKSIGGSVTYAINDKLVSRAIEYIKANWNNEKNIDLKAMSRALKCNPDKADFDFTADDIPRGGKPTKAQCASLFEKFKTQKAKHFSAKVEVDLIEESPVKMEK